MENKKIALAKFKNKIRNLNKKAWIGIGVIGGFIVLAIACLIVAIYSSGSSLGEFFVENGGWFILVFAIVFALAFTYTFYQIRKRSK